jgi:hypothetical protein
LDDAHLEPAVVRSGQFETPFGGYEQSGNGRESGDHAFSKFIETKAVIGYAAAGQSLRRRLQNEMARIAR